MAGVFAGIQFILGLPKGLILWTINYKKPQKSPTREVFSRNLVLSSIMTVFSALAV